MKRFLPPIQYLARREAMAMTEAQVFGEAPVSATAFEKRGIILVKHELDGGKGRGRWKEEDQRWLGQ